MAQQTALERALAKIDADIADLERARSILIASDNQTEAPREKKPRKPRKPRGLPAADGNDL